ncbi:MAG: hypothetical protein EXR69_13680 [Myxococcales bacterium]|nr:hypothetical protein [Myxococcales bacterium]
MPRCESHQKLAGRVVGSVPETPLSDPRTLAALVDTAAARRDAGLYACADGVLTFIGPDARRFCNGMFTNNIRNLPVGRANQNAMVDDKARVQGLHDVACLADQPGAGGHFRVTLEGVTVEQFQARYEKYIIFDDVELTDVSDGWRILTLQGPGTAARLLVAGLPVPMTEGEVLAIGGDLTGATVTRRARSVAGGVDLCVPVGVSGPWDSLGPCGDPASLERLRVEAGLVRWPVDMGERALPHEINVVPRMCNFEKGCYIGQEVINRIDVMGQVTKKVWGLVADSLLEPGGEVRLGDDVVGTVLSGVQEEGFTRSLVLLRKAAWTPGLLVDAGGKEARVSALPFG